MKSSLITSLVMSSAFMVVPAIVSASATPIPDTSMINLTGQASSTAKLGRSMASGDFNGDGFEDIASGAAGNTTGNYVAVIYGSATTLAATTLSSSNSSILSGGATDTFGVSVAAGNFNDDAYDDLIIGASTDSGGGSNSGKVYIVYGSEAEFTSETISSDTNVVQITGPSGSQFGMSVALGEVNGDDIDDLVVGATGFSGSAGAVFVMPGAPENYINSDTSEYSYFSGEAASDVLGTSVAVGEVTGDEYADIVVGATSNDDGGSAAGAVYIIPGQASDYSLSTSIGTVAQFTGEVAGDTAGAAVAVSKSSLIGDANNDIVVSATANDDATANAGATYIIPGITDGFSGTESLSAETVIEISGETGADALGNEVVTADLNQDGYEDLIIATSAHSSNTGQVYLFVGSADGFSSSSASTGIPVTSSTATQVFGRSIATADLNGDGFPELSIGATKYNSDSGAMYVGYLYIDADGDGVVGDTGLIGATDQNITYDCSDTDATVTEDQTYYADADGDTLGDVEVTTSVCSSVAPDGYVANATDTNDSIANNGVEIDGDSIDNDEDGLIDEVNTLADNGAHPFYSTQDPTDTTAVATNILSVTGIANGMIEVTYADNSVYDYFVYTPTTKTTNVEQYENTGYGIVLHKKGKQVYLVNLYTGDQTDTVTIKKSGFSKSDMVLKDLRNNNKDEVIVTGKTKAKVTLAIVKVNSATGALTKTDSEKIVNKKVAVTKTKATSTKIKLRSSKGKTLEVFNVTKKYTLKHI